MKTLGYMLGTTAMVGVSFMVSTIIINAIRTKMTNNSLSAGA
jgi:hypothetical protein